MVERRKYRRERYVVAAIITASIFIIGFLLGLVIESKRVNYLENFYTKQKIDFVSSQVQYQFLDFIGNKESCSVINYIFTKNLENLEKARIRLVNYARSNKMNDETFKLLKREYTLEEIKYWMLAREAREICNESFVRILYFYSNDEECPKCGDQEFVLNYLKKRFGQDLLTFALDAQLTEENIINVLKSYYNVTRYPTLIVEDEKLEGFIATDILFNKICDYNKNAKACKE